MMTSLDDYFEVPNKEIDWHNVVDEFRITLNPIIIGLGKSLFEGIKERLNLQLYKPEAYRSSNVIFFYQSTYKQ